MRMTDLGNQKGLLYIIDTPTAVDCTKDVCFCRSLRSLVECMVPCCGFHLSSTLHPPPPPPGRPLLRLLILILLPPTSTVTVTFFGNQKGRVSFCIHDDPSRPHPHPLLLEFAVPTSYLAKEMQHGLLHIGLECDMAFPRR